MGNLLHSKKSALKVLVAALSILVIVALPVLAATTWNPSNIQVVNVGGGVYEYRINSDYNSDLLHINAVSDKTRALTAGAFNVALSTSAARSVMGHGCEYCDGAYSPYGMCYDECPDEYGFCQCFGNDVPISPVFVDYVSNNPSVATVSLSGSTLTIAPVSTGEAVISVRAKITNTTSETPAKQVRYTQPITFKVTVTN